MPHMLKLAVAVLALAALAPGAAAQVTDTSPQGMVAFFMTDTESCPTGWRLPDLARGRVLVGTDATANVGVTVNEPMHDRKPPEHRHAVTLKFELKSKSIAAGAGDNEQGAKSGTKSFDVETETAESGWGFTQLVVCEKQ
jgi:hypothetical protein